MIFFVDYVKVIEKKESGVIKGMYVRTMFTSIPLYCMKVLKVRYSLYYEF